jgi:hypothetical protein
MNSHRTLFDYDETELAEIVQAARMYAHLRTGGALQPLTTSVRLPPEESAYLDVVLILGEFVDADWYEEVPQSSVSLRGVRAALRNYIARKDAEARWREVPGIRVVVTDRRLMVSQEGHWGSLSHDRVLEFRPQPADFTATLGYDGSPAIRMRGPAVARICVVLALMLEGVDRLGEVPEFAVFTDVLEEIGEQS